MFDDIKQNFLKWGIEQFNTLRQEFNFVGDPNIPPQEKVELAAEKALPYIKPYTGWTGKAKVAAASVAAANGLRFVKKEHLEDVSARLLAITKNEVRDGITDMVSRGATPENAQKSVQGLREFLVAFPEDVHISSAEAFDAGMPPEFRNVLFELWEYDTTIPAADRVRQWRSEIENTSDADLEKKLLSTAQTAQVDILTDATYEIMQKCTPDALEVFVEELKNDLSTKKVNAFLSRGVSYADEFCTAAKDGQLDTIAGSTKGVEFAAEAHTIFTILENAFIAAGLVPDNNPVEAYKKAIKNQPPPSSGNNNSGNNGPKNGPSF